MIDFVGEYKKLLRADTHFVEFVDKHKHMTTEEIAEKYNIDLDAVKRTLATTSKQTCNTHTSIQGMP